MKIVKPAFFIEDEIDGNKILRKLEKAARTCYKSEDKITDISAPKMIKSLINRGHESVLEHEKLTVRIICDRGISHELVRHRIASFSQESTRYVASNKYRDKQYITEQDCIDRYCEGMSIKKIALKSKNYTELDIHKILVKNNITTRPVQNPLVTNETYFDKIDTPEKAYLLGLIFADGNIQADKNLITISQNNDEQWWILNMVRDFIQPEVKSLNIYNKHICDTILSYGITQNKVYTKQDIDKLWNVTELYHYDFLRGLLDGSGDINWFYQDNSQKCCNIQFRANKFLIENIVELLSIEFNYKPQLLEQDELYRLIINNNDIGKEICIKLYSNFKFPYGHSKTYRWYDYIEQEIPVNYSAINSNQEFYVIKPLFFNDKNLWLWGNSMLNCEINYNDMINFGATPEQARSILPNSLKTEIVVTMNIREWRHFFKLRTDKSAHPQMREIANSILNEFKQRISILFDDINNNTINSNQMRDKQNVEKQYKDSSNLQTRKNLHQKYSTSKIEYKDWIFKNLNFFDGCKILELGCGMGDLWENRLNLIGQKSSLTLSDISQKMVYLTAKKYSTYPNLNIFQIDIEDIPFENDSFDFVVANSMLYHVPNLLKGLNEVYRVLKPNGIFYTTTFGENGLHKYIGTTLKEFDQSINISGDITFTLQNGKDILNKYFETVDRIDYKNSLQITNINDLVDYIFSMSSVSFENIDRQKLFNFYQSKKNQQGFIEIQKEYGLFICQKE